MEPFPLVHMVLGGEQAGDGSCFNIWHYGALSGMPFDDRWASGTLPQLLAGMDMLGQDE